MAAVRVTPMGNQQYEVQVSATTPTTHRVTAPADYVQKLTQGRITPEQLIERSFVFLLERESNTSILRQFELKVIGHYFPEYEREIVK